MKFFSCIMLAFCGTMHLMHAGSQNQSLSTESYTVTARRHLRSLDLPGLHGWLQGRAQAGLSLPKEECDRIHASMVSNRAYYNALELTNAYYNVAIEPVASMGPLVSLYNLGLRGSVVRSICEQKSLLATLEQVQNALERKQTVKTRSLSFEKYGPRDLLSYIQGRDLIPRGSKRLVATRVMTLKKEAQTKRSMYEKSLQEIDAIVATLNELGWIRFFESIKSPTLRAIVTVCTEMSI